MLRGLVALLFVFDASGLVLPTVPCGRPISRERHAPLCAQADDTSGTKITIKPPGVKVKVRTPEETAARQAADAKAAEAAASEDMSISIKVNKPVAAPPAPAPARAPNMPKLTESENLLLNATQGANCTKLLSALQAGANPNILDPKGRTPLHFMAGVGLAPACVLLIHYGAQVDIRDNDGLTPMHMAAGYANAQTLKVLVQAGADTDLVADNQGKPVDVVMALGEYQYAQAREKQQNQRFGKKKDEKLEKLKDCMDVLDDPKKVRAEADWDEMLREVMKLISVQDGTVSGL